MVSQEEIFRILRPIIIGGAFGGIAGFENILAWPGGIIADPSSEISEIMIRKNWFKKTVSIQVSERERFAIWCVNSGEKCYWIDRRGIVFAEAPLTEGSLVSIVFDSREGNLFFGSRVEEDRFSDNLILILENFSQTNLTAKKITFDLQKQELSFSTEEGLAVIFGLRYDSAKSIPLIKDWDYGSKAKKYIDLTVENRILYQ